MGLAERKVKQRIGADPRNLAWSENAARFGHAYLAKMGWDPTRGLGLSGEGMTSHIAVAHKLDQLGIGANRPGGPDAIAWKQNNEFEDVLSRLNATTAADAETPEEKRGGSNDVEEVVEAEDIEMVESKKDKKKDKKEKKEKEKKEKKKKNTKVDETEDSSVTPPVEAVQAPTPRRMAHRAKFLAAKRLATTSSSTAMSEILGISSHSASPAPVLPSTSTPTPTSLSSPTTQLTPSSHASTPITPVDDDQIKTSTTSVGDYFKNLMKARMQANSSGTSTSSSVTATAAPSPAINRDEDEDYSMAPRTGLGARRIAGAEAPSQSFVPSTPPLKADPTAEITSSTEVDGAKKSKKGKRRREEDVEDGGDERALGEDAGEGVEAPRSKKGKERKEKKSKKVRKGDTEDGIQGQSKLVDDELEKKKKKKRRGASDQ